MTPTEESAGRYVSTGHLPAGGRVQLLLDECHRELAGLDEGAVSDVYPALAEADPRHFGIAVVAVDGAIFRAGDVDVPFSLMSVAKPFVFALACRRHGIEAVVDRVGVDATGAAFDSVAAVERSPDGRTNPMVNSGAIACTAFLAEGAGTVPQVWQVLREGLSEFAGRDLAVDERVHRSAEASNLRNRAIAQLLSAGGHLADPALAVDLYTRQSSLSVTAVDLAVMGATLADGGVNPVSGRRVVDPEVAARTLAVMATAGMYEHSGQWLVQVGLPGKSGIGGGIVAAAPGKGGLGTFSPPLDAAGNSVRGLHVARRLSRRLGLDLFGSPVVGPVAAGQGDPGPRA